MSAKKRWRRENERPAEEPQDREMVESRILRGLSRESLFAALLDVERFPEWGHGLRRVRLLDAPSGPRGLRPGARIQFELSAAGLSHKVESVVTTVETPRLIEWRYLSGASGHGGWLLEDAGDPGAGPVRVTLSTDYSVHPAWLDRMARKPFFRRLISDLMGRSLRRLEDGLRENREPPEP